MRRSTALLLIAVTAVLLLSPGVAFRAAYLYEANALWLNGPAVLLDETEGSVTAEQFRENLQRYSEDSGHSISVEVYSPDLEAGDRHFYSTTQVAEGREPSFIRGETIVQHPMKELDSAEARFVYSIDTADSAAAVNFLQWAHTQGFSGQVLGTNAAAIVLSDSGFTLLLLLILTAFVAAAAHVVTRSRSVGVHRLLGKTVAEHLFGDLSTSRRSLSAAIIGLPLIAIVVLVLYNGLHRSGIFFLAFAALVGVGFLAVLLGYLSGHAIAATPGIVGGVRGASPNRLLIDAVAFMRLISLLVALGVVSSAAGATGAALAAERDRDQWVERSDVAYVEIGGGRDLLPIAPDLRELDRAGNLILSDPFFMSTDHVRENRILLVNRTWVEMETELGHDYLPTEESEVVVVFPGDPDEAVRMEIEQQFRFEAELGGEEPTTIRPVTGPEQENAFTYETRGPASVTGPVLVILPLGLVSLGDLNLTAKLTAQSLLFPSEDVIEQFRAISGAADRAIVASGPLAERWAQQHSDLVSRAAGLTISLVLAVALATLLVITTALAYHQVNRRRLQVSHILGRNPWWDRPGLMVLEVIFAAVPLLWLAFRLREQLQLAAINAPSTLTYSGMTTVSPLLYFAVLGAVLLWAILPLLTVHTYSPSGKEFA